MIRVLVADDQELVRSGLVMLLDSADDIEVCGEAGNGEEAVTLAGREHPDVVLMDIRMPGMDGLAATKQLRSAEEVSAPKVLILTTFDLDEYAYEALRSGASGFMLKDTPPADLLSAVRTIAKGEAIIAPTTTRRLIERFVSAEPTESEADPVALEALTDREREVFRLIALGLSNDEIAEELVISPLTAKTHVGRVLMKLNLNNRVHAVILAYETGVVTPGSALPQSGGADA